MYKHVYIIYIYIKKKNVLQQWFFFQHFLVKR